jgi:hypothetical protein
VALLVGRDLGKRRPHRSEMGACAAAAFERFESRHGLTNATLYERIERDLRKLHALERALGIERPGSEMLASESRGQTEADSRVARLVGQRRVRRCYQVVRCTEPEQLQREARERRDAGVLQQTELSPTGGQRRARIFGDFRNGNRELQSPVHAVS